MWDKLKSFNLKKDYPEKPYIHGIFESGAFKEAKKLEILAIKEIDIKMK